MKILSAEQQRAADAFTICNEPIASIDLMERAAMQCVDWILEHYPVKPQTWIFCGTGNNGGDGLVIARHLATVGYEVTVIISHFSLTETADFKTNYLRLSDTSCKIRKYEASVFQQDFSADGLIIDALLGSGITRAASGELAEIIRGINALKGQKISIDMPSGMPCDKTLSDNYPAVIPHVTLTFQAPKLAFFLPENIDFVGEIVVLDIGLQPDFIASCETHFFALTNDSVQSRIQSRKKNSHKGTYGHALIIGGSLGKIGALTLASKAALRTGAGKVSVVLPYHGNVILQTAVPEAMTIPVKAANELSGEVPELPVNCVFGIGPGMGTAEGTVHFLETLLNEASRPVLLDADALNILALHPHFWKLIPANSILTPHPGEFERLAGPTYDSLNRLQHQLELSKKHKVFIVLKGANTSISTPEGKLFFNTTGNAGMATAGSGDVLTGIITGILAQGYSSEDAAIIGTYFHGKAGDAVARQRGMMGVIAGDIIESLVF
jgi:ADP-dependent NAD(P)H-hydrate dehydratase / NAD(P)H-hydrate epimerase